MKLRLMGTPTQNEAFLHFLKKAPEVTIISESKPYANRGSTTLERIYIELELNQTFTPADVVEPLLDYPGIFNY